MDRPGSHSHTDGEPSSPAAAGLSRRAWLGMLGSATLGFAGCVTDDLSSLTGESTRAGPTASLETESTAAGTEIGSARGSHTGDARVSGSLRRWHRVTLDFDGPEASETGEPNPFLDYRLDVVWTSPSGRTVVVPGYYAADGNAADTGATDGTVWRAHLAPDEIGTWRYRVSFRRGPGVAVDPWLADGATGTVESGSARDGARAAVDLASAPGEAVTAADVDARNAERGGAVDGATGALTVVESDKLGRDFRARGRLADVGDHYLRLLGTGEPFLKNGANSPENFLAYRGFDGTRDTDGSFLHEYAPHVDDWSRGDPTWGGDSEPRGAGIIGAVNYLASQGVNSQYLLTYSGDGGDGGDVWPWVEPTDRTRYDCSKLAQWERVFAHMTRRGVALHLLTQERENDRAMHGGRLGPERRLYYRELVARFAHHPALVWNLGEETTNTTWQLRTFAAHIRALDPYEHPIVVHTLPTQHDAVYGPLLGFAGVSGPSIQTDTLNVGPIVQEWRERSRAAGRPWAVMADEIGDYRVGVPEDGATYRGTAQADLRTSALWGALMAGAAGVEWYFGYETQGGDLELEDFRTRESWWATCRHALAFVSHLPLPHVTPAPERVRGVRGSCLAGDDVLGVHFPAGVPDGSDAAVALRAGDHRLRWYDPRTGRWANGGEVTVDGGTGATRFTPVGEPPFADDVALLVSWDD